MDGEQWKDWPGTPALYPVLQARLSPSLSQIAIPSSGPANNSTLTHNVEAARAGQDREVPFFRIKTVRPRKNSVSIQTPVSEPLFSRQTENFPRSNLTGSFFCAKFVFNARANSETPFAKGEKKKQAADGSIGSSSRKYGCRQQCHGQRVSSGLVSQSRRDQRKCSETAK